MENAARPNDQAVAPVIAVLLMVAITVVLAATVFLLATNAGNQSGASAPTLQLRVDEPADRLVVDAASPESDWQRIQLRVTLASRILLNGDPSSATGTAVAANTFSANLATSQNLVGAGEFVGFCTSASAGPATVTIRDSISNEVRGEHRFTQLDVC